MNSRLVSGIVFFFALLLFYRLHSTSSRDPTSLLFNPRTGYEPRYSAIRTEEAEAFIASFSNHTNLIKAKDDPAQKKICVGIPSIARKGARYLRSAVGSLLDGLTPEERAQINLVVFIPHSDPTVHPAYAEQWLPDLANEVLTYDVSDEEMKHIKQMEKDGGLFREKGLYDYAYLVKHCYGKNTPYIAMLEDDTIAMDGWYHRTMAAVAQAETLSAEKKASPEFLYLRLFYTEEFLGWNSEDWATYLFYSSIALGLPIAVLLAVRTGSTSAKRHITTRSITIVSGVIIAFVALFFIMGPCTVIPLPTGVNEMPKYGCCSQGFVFPREKAMALIKYLEGRKIGFVDSLTEEYANEHDELRWAITPSVLQHVGRKSSKVDDFGPQSKWGMSVAEKIWNFAFERYDPEALRAEHLSVTQKDT